MTPFRRVAIKTARSLISEGATCLSMAFLFLNKQVRVAKLSGEVHKRYCHRIALFIIQRNYAFARVFVLWRTKTSVHHFFSVPLSWTDPLETAGNYSCVKRLMYINAQRRPWRIVAYARTKKKKSMWKQWWQRKTWAICFVHNAAASEIQRWPRGVSKCVMTMNFTRGAMLHYVFYAFCKNNGHIFDQS